MSVKSSKFILNSLILAFSVPSFAQSSDMSEHIETIVDAKPLERQEPKYPINAARNGQEGWAKVSFVIDQNGNVVDPVIQDSSGLKSFEKETLKAVKNWKYSPAMQDGQPIEQCQMEVQIDYRLSGESGVTRKFQSAYQQVMDTITAKELELAQKMLSKMADSKMWNHSENSYFWLADSMYAKEIDDMQRELVGVNRALASGKDALNPATFLYLLTRQFALFTTDTQYSKAMQSYKQILQQEDNTAVVANLKPYASQLQNMLQGSEPLIHSTKIRTSGSTYHELSRESFALHINEGELDEVQLRCANKRARFTASENSEWRIPASWGQCTLFVTGTPDSQFDVIELGAYKGQI
jgi:TonB family protein